MDFILHEKNPSLALYLPLYEPDGASLMSKDKHGHLCTVTGAIWTPSGREFDGQDDYIDCGTSDSLRMDNSDWTMEAWVKIKAIGNLMSISERANQWGMRISAGGNLQFVIPGIASATADTRILSALTLYHLGIVYDQGADKLYYYVNGILSSFPTFSSTPSGAPGTIYIGARKSSNDLWVNGLIGEIRIYGRFLTPLEIQHNYLATKWRYQ